MSISRHEIDTEDVRELMDYELTMLKQWDGKSPGGMSQLDDVQRKAARLLGMHSAVTSDWHEIARLVKLRTRTIAAIFRLVNQDGEVQVDLPGIPSTTLEATGPNHFAHVAKWKSGFFCAVICRDADALETLCDIPSELMQAPGVGSDAFNFRYVEALQAFQKGEAQAPQRLVEAMEGTDPSQIQNAEIDWVLDIAVPQMDVLFRLLDNDADAFNTALEKAVEAHKSYWSKKKRYRHRDPKGFISVPLTGLCAYAFERDVPIEVESDYIPRELYSGEYS